MPVLTYCSLGGKISTKYLAPIPTNILSLRSLGMGISTLLGAHGGQFGRSREKYRDCRNITVVRVQEAFFFISDDLKWNAHVEYVIAKAAKRLYALRLLKRAGVTTEDILKVFT